MANFLSGPAYAAKLDLQQHGIDVKLGQINEFFAPFLGYHNRSEMKPDFEQIEAHVKADNVLVVLQCSAAFKKIKSALRDHPSTDVMPVYHAVKKALVDALPRTTFDDEDHLLRGWVKNRLAEHLTDGSVAEFADAQERVSKRCEVFESDDIDFPDLKSARDVAWTGEYMGNMYARKDDGTPDYLGQQIGTSSTLRFEKLGRALLAKDFQANTGAYAWVPDSGCGGIEL